MAKALYVGVNDVARKVKSAYIGVNGVARKITSAYIGVNGIAKKIYPSISVYTETTQTYMVSSTAHTGSARIVILTHSYVAQHEVKEIKSVTVASKVIGFGTFNKITGYTFSGKNISITATYTEGKNGFFRVLTGSISFKIEYVGE